MSKGPGRLQQRVLDGIKAADGYAAENELCWTVAAALGEIESDGEVAPGIRRGRLSQSFYKGFKRATATLIESGRVQGERRKLRTTDELVRWFPYKTLRLEVMELRRLLLPELVLIAAKKTSVTPAGEQEEGLVAEAVPADPELRQNVAADWYLVRGDLHELLQTSPSPAVWDVTFRILARGSHYFDANSTLWIGCAGNRVRLVESASLSQILRAASGLLAPDLIERLHLLFRRVLPRERSQQRMLKDFLFRLGRFQHGEVPGLKDTSRLALLHAAPDVVRSLPGFAPAVPASADRKVPWMERRRGRGPTFDPLIDQLLDRHVFDPFVFLRSP